MAEQETFISRSLQKSLKGNVKKSLLALKEEQKAVEQAIKQLIEADTRLKELFDLMVSVPGIGPVIATELLITTNEMQTINDPKKLAASATVRGCGPTAMLELLLLTGPPVQYRSGSSIRGKARVSHQARKRLKSLIHMGTMSAIQVKGDLQDYYHRKLGEGKHSMLVLNAVRFVTFVTIGPPKRLIHRVALLCVGVKNIRTADADKFYPLSLA